jgi:DeoR/GlpR family transcriptional regulator of sugar metabolism
MLPAERRKRILELVEERHAISVGELCAGLEVSEMTVRRDLRMLATEGLLQRVHGGVIAKRSRSYEPPHMLRASVNVEAKRAISEAAVRLVHEGDSLALDVGTTTLEIARKLVGIRNLTVLTASLPIANILVDAPDIRLILTGGIVRKHELSMVGHVAENTLRGFHADKAFIGIGGIHTEAGLTEYNLEDALVKRHLIGCAEQVIVVADNSKLQRTCFVSVADLSVVDTLITDCDAPHAIVAELSRKGVDVLVAGGDEPVSGETA